jgi:hypothetical protein
MTPLEMSCVHSPKKMDMVYGENNGTPLHQEFHYTLISTWLVKTRFLLLMLWLLTQHGRWWLWMSLVDQQIQLQKLTSLLRSINIEVFIKGTTLLWWPWRCMAHSSMMCIVSSRNMFVFSMIDNHKVIYPCLFAFKFFK